MSPSDKKTLVVAISTILGAVGGRWMAPKVGAALGLTLGPWGAAAGGVIGALVGAAVGSRVVGKGEFPELSVEQNPLGLRSGL